MVLVLGFAAAIDEGDCCRTAGVGFHSKFFIGSSILDSPTC